MGRFGIDRAFAASVVLGLAGAAGATPFFSGIGDLPGGDVQSWAFGVSNDGSTVVGMSQANPNNYGTEAVPIRWTQAGGIEALFVPNPPETGPFAYDASADGSVIVGSDEGGGYGAWMWTEATGADYSTFVPPTLPGSDPNVFSVSADGAYAAGVYFTGTNWAAIRWHTSGGGYDVLGDLPGGGAGSWAWDISGDGAVVVGCADAALAGDCDTAFRWTETTGMTTLPGLPSGYTARAVSSDGSTIVGANFVWTETGGFVEIGDLPGGSTAGNTYAVSGDGSVVVGWRSVAQTGWPYGAAAFIWDPVHGIRNLRDVLVGQGLDLEGWTLFEARAVSDDGRTIAGTGINPNGTIEGWVAVLPEPSAVSLVALALAGVGVGPGRKLRLR